jgi:hypothetical protein
MRGARVLGTLVCLALVLFVIGFAAGGIGPTLGHPNSPAEIVEAVRGRSGAAFVILSVGVVLLAPYATMLTVAGWSGRTRRTRLWFALGTVALTVATVVGALLAS